MKKNLVWQKIFKASDYGKYPSEDLVRFISKNFSKNKKRSKINILEIGSGTGGNLIYLAKEGFNVNGVDFSKIAVSKSKIFLNKKCPGWKGKIQYGDILNFNFKKNNFDVVIDNEVSCCFSLEETKKFYTKILKSLRKKGKIFLRTFSTNSYGYKTGKKIGSKTYVPSVRGVRMFGPHRFSSSSDIDKIFNKKYKMVSKEVISRSINNMKNKIVEWIVEAEKNV